MPNYRQKQRSKSMKNKKRNERRYLSRAMTYSDDYDVSDFPDDLYQRAYYQESSGDGFIVKPLLATAIELFCHTNPLPTMYGLGEIKAGNAKNKFGNGDDESELKNVKKTMPFSEQKNKTVENPNAPSIYSDGNVGFFIPVVSDLVAKGMWGIEKTISILDNALRFPVADGAHLPRVSNQTQCSDKGYSNNYISVCINDVFSATNVTSLSGAKHVIDTINSRGKYGVENLVDMIDALYKYKISLNSQSNKSSIEIINKSLDGLWNIANQINELTNNLPIENLRFNYQIGEGVCSSFDNTESDAAEIKDLSERISNVAINNKEQFDTIKSNVLSPVVFIDNFVESEIQRFNADLNKNIELEPDDTITIRFKASRGKTVDMSYSLREIAVGSHLRDQNMHGYSSPHYENKDERLLVARMEGMNIQGLVTTTLNSYKNNELNRGIIVSNVEAMINYRCLEYLQRVGLDTTQGRIVERFLNGEIRAHRLFYKDYEIHGAFVIHENGHGVLLSIDESVNFEFLMKSTYRQLNQPDYPVFNHNPNIKSWMLSKLSMFAAESYKDDPLSDFIGYSKPTVIGYSTIITNTPYKLQAPQNKQELKSSFFDKWMDKLAEDYNYLIYSRSEYTTDNLINYVKNILTAGSVAVNFIPGIGPIGSFILGAIMDIVNTSITIRQSQIADRPGQAMSYRDEAILAGVFTALGTTLPAITARNKIEKSLRLLQKTKPIAAKFSHYGRLRSQWRSLTNHQKVMLLGSTLEGDTSYRQLETLTKRETVNQSIYHNLLRARDGNLHRAHWGTFSHEKEKVTRWIQSDASLLDEMNISLKRYILAPPTIECITKSGDVIEEAALWIFGDRRKKDLVLQLMGENNNRVLKDFNRVYNIYREMFPDAANLFRTSGTAGLMGTDIAAEGCRQALNDINLAYVTGALTKDEFGAGIYSVIMQYKPFVQHNTEIARMLYILSQFKEGGSILKILTSETEEILRIPQVAFRAPPNMTLEEWKNARKKYIKKSRDKQFEDPEAFSRGKNINELNIGSRLVNDQTSEFELTNMFNADTGEMTIENMGTLSGLIEKVRKSRFQRESLDWTLVHGTILRHYSDIFQLAPQAFVLGISNSTLFDKGLCLPMVYAFSVGLKQGRARGFLDNLYYGATAATRSGGESQLIMALNDIYTKPTISKYLSYVDFGIGNLEGTIDDIAYVVNRKTETSLFALTTDYSEDIDAHTMMVGVVIENGRKSFHFYDPDIGYFRYNSLNNLRKAMAKTIGQPEVGVAYNAFGTASKPRYKMSLIDTEGLGELQIQVGRGGRNVKISDLSGDGFANLPSH